ncbi:Laminin-like protein epi-1 [Linum perenne]
MWPELAPRKASPCKTHFVSSSDGVTLQIHEFSEPATSPSSIQKSHLKEVTTISLTDGGLLFPDGQGTIVGAEALTALAQHLAQIRLMVSPEGFCFHDVSGFGMYVDFEIYYFRLYDLFCWSNHGIRIVTTTTPTTMTCWNRSELRCLVTKPVIEYVMIRKEEYENLRRKAKEVDGVIEELDGVKKKEEELKRKVKKQSEEMEEMKVETEELMKMMKKKEDEISAEKKSLIDEMEVMGKMIEELRRKVKAQNETMEKTKVETEELMKKMKKREDEMLVKMKNMVDEMEAMKRVNEELKRKVKAHDEEIEKMKVETEELRKKLRGKDEELKRKEEEILLEMNIVIEELKKKMKMQGDEITKMKAETEELGKKVREKMHEIEQLEETVKKNERKVKKQDSEILEMKAETEDLMKKNDDLRKKVKTLNQEIEEKNDDIDELGKTLRSKDREIRALKVLDADDASSLELQKLRRQNEELQRESREKDMELKRLKEDIDEMGKTLRSKDREIRALEVLEADDANSLELQNENEALKKKLEQCNNNSYDIRFSWAVYDNTKYLKDLGEARSMQVHLSTRQQVPRRVFGLFNRPLLHRYAMPVTKEWAYSFVYMVDDELTNWPAPPSTAVFFHSAQGTLLDDVRRIHFDTDNWYYMKTTHPEGGLTMLAYYDGNRNQAQVLRVTVPLPFSNEMVFQTDKKFYLIHCDALGLRVAFMYRTR